MRDTSTLEKSLAFMTDCTLATVDDLAMRKRPPVREFRRQCSIAQEGVDAMRRFGVTPAGTRAECVLDSHGGSVVEYAQAVRHQHGWAT